VPPAERAGREFDFMLAIEDSSSRDASICVREARLVLVDYKTDDVDATQRGARRGLPPATPPLRAALERIAAGCRIRPGYTSSAPTWRWP